MYAIVATGGKQYRVEKGSLLRVEKLIGEAGEKLNLDQILLLGGDKDLKIGTPYVDGAKVEAQIVEQGRAKKIDIIKKKRRKGYRKKQGHRQSFTALKILNIIN